MTAWYVAVPSLSSNSKGPSDAVEFSSGISSNLVSTSSKVWEPALYLIRSIYHLYPCSLPHCSQAAFTSLTFTECHPFVFSWAMPDGLGSPVMDSSA